MRNPSIGLNNAEVVQYKYIPDCCKCMETRLTPINSNNAQSIIHPHPLTLKNASLWMLAPFSTKYFTVSKWPPLAARYRGVS